MSTKVIEQQLADLQTRVTTLERANRTTRKGWREIIGVSKGQKLDAEAARLGAQWRARENKRK